MLEGNVPRTIPFLDEQIVNGLKHFVAGTVGGNSLKNTNIGISGLVVGHPLDTVKVRIQNDCGRGKYTGTFQSTLKIVKEEGVRGLFKGIFPPMIGVGLVNAFLFGIYGTILNSIQASHENNNLLLPFFIAGSCSGFANSFITGPVELAKCLQQQMSVGTAKVVIDSGKYSIFSILRESFRLWGLKGPFRGLLCTILRDTPSFGVYFLTYEAMMISGNSKNIPANADLYTEFERYTERYGCPQKVSIIQCLPEATTDPSLTQIEHATASSTPPLFLTLFAGALSGVLGWIVTYPLDVIKTRIQSTPLNTRPKRITETLSVLLKTESGVKSLFRGMNVTIIRAIPTNAIIFLGFSTALQTLESV